MTALTIVCILAGLAAYAGLQWIMEELRWRR
jgi:hypothetical protein